MSGTRQMHLRDRYVGAGIVCIMVAIVLGGWFLLAHWQVVPRLFLPGPADVWAAFGSLSSQGFMGVSLGANIWATTKLLLVAFTVTVLIAVPIGVIAGYDKRVYAVMAPFLGLFRSLPPLAYLPVLIGWFGIGNFSKVVMLYVLAFPMIVIPTAQAIQLTRRDRLLGARSLGASTQQIFFRVLIPGALPEILGGLRYAYIWMFTALVAAEMIGATAGLGWMVWSAAGLFRTDAVFVGVFLLALMGVTGERVISYVQLKITPWAGKI